MRIPKPITVLTAVAVAVMPFSGFAGGGLTVNDTIAGLGTEVTVGDARDGDAATVEPPFGPAIDIALSIDDRGTGRGRIRGEDLQIAGRYAVNVERGTETVAAGAFDVLPDTVDGTMSTAESDRASVLPDGLDEATVTVTLRDQYGNPLPDRMVELVSSRAEDTVTALESATDATGAQRFAVTTRVPGAIALRAMDLMSGKLLPHAVDISAGTPAVGGYMVAQAYPSYGYAPAPAYPPTYGAPGSWAPQRPYYGSTAGRFGAQLGAPAIADHFEIAISKTRMQIGGDAADIQIRAVDRNGSPVDAYTGTVEILSTDPAAVLPGNGRLTFEPKWLGVRTCALCLQFRSPPEPGQTTHELFVQEIDPAGNPTSVTGRIAIAMDTGDVGATGKGGIVVTSHEQDGAVNAADITLEGTAPPFINLEVTGGLQDVQGDTDEQGRFSIPLKLDDRMTDHTLRIRDALNRYDSGNLRLRLDTAAPVLGAVTFDPPTPEEGANVTATVRAEAGLASVLLALPEREIALAESSSSSGTYTAAFAAPEAGSHAVFLRATDDAGNTGTMQATLTVLRQDLPAVRNLRATAKTKMVTLSWDPSEDESVTGYRIYVGTSSRDYNVPLDYPTGEGRPTSVDVGNLQPGTTYFFAVTATDGERESGEMSAEASATVLGLTLEVTPQDGALLLEWSSLDLDVPLAAFILEYGVEPDAYTEQRSINGDLRAYVLRDLLNNVRYYARLTPVTTTGDVLEDLASEGNGMPAGSAGFRPGPSDPIPPGFSPPAGTPRVPPVVTNPHQGAPELSKDGLPPVAWWIAGILTLIAGYVHVQRRRTMRMTMDFFRSMETQYRNR